MDIVYLSKPFQLIAMKAASFPDGIPDVHERLRKTAPSGEDLSYYGISYPAGTDTITYLAARTGSQHAVDQAPDLELFTVRQGPYLCEVLRDWKSDLPAIRETFEQLIADPRTAPNGYRLEEYSRDGIMRCLVPLTPSPTYREFQRQSLASEFQATFDSLSHIVADFDQEALDSIPFEGSWSAGQVTEHILISASRIPDTRTGQAIRFHDQHVVPLRDLFLDFNRKFEASPSLLPAPAGHDKEILLQRIRQTALQHAATIATSNLDALCLDMEFPIFGNMTRYEWLRFIQYHTQRHLNQIERIRDQLK